VAQVFAISFLLLSLHWKSLSTLGMAWMWGVVIFSLASAVDYFRKFWRTLDDQIKQRRRKELLLLEREQKRTVMP
jgi:phosphatidylglycerophosphate synthase